MLSKRIIACLDVRDGTVVKGVNFEGSATRGDPAALAARYNREGIDEIVILDVTATLEARQARAQTIRAVAREIFLPLAVGGGIRTEDDAAAAIEAGADKVSLNTAALADPVAHHTARHALRQPGRDRRHRRQAQRRSLRGLRPQRHDQTARDAVDWAREAAERGAGEILLTSIDRDGTQERVRLRADGARCRRRADSRHRVGRRRHLRAFRRRVHAGRADAALAASIFHFNERSVSELKEFLASRGIPVRLFKAATETRHGNTPRKHGNTEGLFAWFDHSATLS